MPQLVLRFKMNAKEIKKTIDKADKNPIILKSEEYINAQLNKFGLHQIGLQMGPNCNRSCSHCYGNYGPNRKGLPNPKIIQKTLEQAVELNMFGGLVLTDGEPLRHENKEVIKIIANYSDKIPLAIMSNGAFARTQQNALDWMRFLKDNGFDLTKRTNQIQISLGAMYKVNFNNYFRINNAIKQTFPNLDVGKHFAYTLIGMNNKDEVNLLSKTINGLEYFFGKRKEVQLNNEKNNGPLKYISVYPKKGNPIKIHYRPCAPDGRAKNFSIFDSMYPIKDLKMEELGFNPDFHEDIWVSNKGDVSFGVSGACVRKAKFYGNIKDEPLITIIDKISKDSVYNAFKLGGARFLYFLGQKVNPDFKVKGRIRCDVCHSFFSKPKLIKEVRNAFENKQKVAEAYRQYIQALDLKKERFL